MTTTPDTMVKAIPSPTISNSVSPSAAASVNSRSMLTDERRAAILSASSISQLQTATADALTVLAPSAMAFWFSPPASAGQPSRIDGLLCPSAGLSESFTEQLGRLATQSVSTLTLQTATVDSQARMVLAALPIPAIAGHCLLLAEDRYGDPTEAASSGTESMTSPPALNPSTASALVCLMPVLSEWGLQFSGRHSSDEAATVAALIELVSRVQSAGDVHSASQRLADSLQSHLGATTAVVGLCRRGLSECRVAAISSGQIVDRLSDETRQIEAVLQESVVRGFSAVWPVADRQNRHALMSHEQYSESLGGSTLVSMPLLSEDGQPAGCLLLIFADADGRVATAERFLRAGSGALGSCLHVLQKLADSQWLHNLRQLRRALTVSRMHVAAWVIGAAATILLLPVTYSVRGDAELQPVERHFVAAPFDGPLAECLVEPGDVVEKDQLLAQMDGREIRWELAEIQATLNKATKERNTQLSSREFGNAEISGHEIQRLEQRESLLKHRDTSLEIRSPVEGVVVTGDHREAEGVPLEMGQTLFEIAPLDAMTVEVCIPEEDIRHVTEGMTVRIQMDAAPDTVLSARIRRIHPRAEIRDGENVFVAEAELDEQPAGLRPGMRGSAKVMTRRRPLGWNLFHKPTAWIVGWLGW
ncbi:MAG: HlyD family efflux transporter periplasmic adaptor subunit [Planctomycetaceae bacterium]|nr:HlyD family efflux transporter periplasmic adaptor subunit [Planctomycetaceae bacterium]